MLTPAELAERNIGLVYALAGDMWRRKKSRQCLPDYDDLVGDGMVGLMQAAMRFDPSRFDGPFSTYAKTRVAGAMIDGYRRRHKTGSHRETLMHEGEALPERSSPSAEVQALDRVVLENVLRATCLLTDGQRMAVGVALSGGSFSAASDAVGISRFTMASRLAEARRRLKVAA